MFLALFPHLYAFCAVSQVNLAYDRYMKARHAIGHALSALRELNQAALTYTEHLPTRDKFASRWRRQVGSCMVWLL